tara:strand:- start:89 stop:1609 length:1521 start_codon:yes stop_codon:yes gene_type:complete
MKSLNEFAKTLCDKWKKDESVSASQADMNELGDIKRMLKDAKISKRPLVIIEEYIEHQNKLLQFADQEVEDSIKEYLDDKNDYGITSDQLTATERHLNAILQPWFGKSLRQIRAAELIKRFKTLWNKNRASGNWKRATYDKYLTAVKGFLKWGQSQEPSLVDPAFPLVKLKRKSGKDNTSMSYASNVKYFSPEDVCKILKASKPNPKGLEGRSLKPLLKDNLNDDELAKMIWSQPIIHVAKSIGISDSAVYKQCKRRGIPTPPSGFWAKVQYGKIPNPKGKMPKEFAGLYRSRTRIKTDSLYLSYDWMPVLVMQFFGACRPSEAMLLQWNAFNWYDGVVVVNKRKLGGGPRYVKMKPNLIKMLKPYYEEADGKGGLLPTKLGDELYPLLYECAAQASSGQGEIKDEDKKAFEKKYKSVRNSAAQATKDIARLTNVKWIKNGPRHSYGTYRYRDLYEVINGSEDARTNHAKEQLRLEMHTGDDCLDKNYIGAGVGLKQVEEYFSIAA